MKYVLTLLLSFSALLHAATPYPLGWKSNPTHSKGLTQIVQHPKFGTAANPPSGTVRTLFYPTNQQDLGACTAFTGVECLDAVYMKTKGAFVHPSFLDLYQQELKHDGSWPNDSGSYTSTILFVLTKSSLCSEKKWPYQTANLGVNPPQCAVKARSYSAIKAYDVPNDDKGYAVRQCIAVLKIPVMTGGLWPGNWFNPKKDAKTGKTYLPYAVGAPVGGHEISIISYDDNLTIAGIKGWVEIHNHWANQNGSPWGDNDTCWFPQSDFFNPKRFEDNGAVEVIK